MRDFLTLESKGAALIAFGSEFKRVGAVIEKALPPPGVVVSHGGGLVMGLASADLRVHMEGLRHVERSQVVESFVGNGKKFQVDTPGDC